MYLDKKLTAAFAIALILLIPMGLCKANPGEIRAGLFPSKTNPGLSEIGKIEFEGASSFSDYELSPIIPVKKSKRNTLHKMIEYYYLELRKIPQSKTYLPPGFITTMRDVLKKWFVEISYFEGARAESGLETILEFYNQNGFHEASADYVFAPDSSAGENVLKYRVKEGPRYDLKEFVINGLDSVSPSVLNKIKKVLKPPLKKPFDEEKIIAEVNAVQRILSNNGYYYSDFDVPVVYKDTVNKYDSVVVEFEPGKRQKISGLCYVDSLDGQKVVTNSMKQKQLEFKVGDWWSKRQIEKSKDNLQSLGTFKYVAIDTASKCGESDENRLPLKVYVKYRKQEDLGGGLYYNKTAFDNFFNAGLEASYLNRNIGGVAQSMNVFARLELRDVSRLTSLNAKPEFETQLGLNYAQPLLWTIDKARIGGVGQFLYTVSKINTYLQLNTASLRLKLPVTLPKWTYFNGMSIDLSIEWQNPANLSEAIDSAMANSEEESDRDRVRESFAIYKTLADFYESNPMYNPTAFILGVTFSGDTRDNLFNPTKGYFTNISFDVGGGLGIAKYFRPQFSYINFTSLNKSSVFALKARTGYIYRWDKENSYVPAERHFFAGGSNSVRGWESRRLRYITPAIRADDENEALDFARDFIGSRAILEGSFEVRWRFGKPRWVSDVVGEIINLGVMTGFVDWGNAFYWMAYQKDKYYEDLEWSDFITGLGVSAGLGFGIQTPVGPLRLDYSVPLYDPTPPANLSKFVPSREKPFEAAVFHIGLGYAF